VLKYFTTNGNQIVDQQNRPIRITSVNWFGFESFAAIVGGLQQRSYQSILLQMKQLNFNAVRITFANEVFLFPSPQVASINYNLNPDLLGLSPLGCLDAIIQYCTTIALRVILSRRAALAGNYYNEPYWYIPSDADFTPQKFQSDWVMLANRYANTAVIGVDLWDEPKQTTTWATGVAATDWHMAATSAGNAILAVNPQWLIFVQGVGADTWWGGNLQGVVDNPIVFNTPNQLVYAVADFPVEIYPQTWLTDPTFPSNMRPRWDVFWGFIFKQNIAPVMISSFGALLDTVQSRQWMQEIVNYADGQFTSDGLSELTANQLGLSWSYSAVNADFPVLGGLLAADWQSVNMKKLSYIDQSFGNPLDNIPNTFPTSIPMNYPTENPTTPVTVPPSNGVPVIQPRGTCVQEDFSSMNFRYFSVAGCQSEMSILPGGYLNMHISQSCPNTRIDSNQFYQNAYVETSFKIGGMGPDFSGVVYAFYSDGIVKPNGLHADEIDVEIVGNGNPGRGWALNTMQLGVWVPNYAFNQYLINLGPYDMVNNFVTYAFQWNYDAIDFFINGQYVYSSSLYQASMGYTQAQKVIFSLWDGTPFPDFSQRMNWNSPRAADFKMIIDYVKICT